MRSARAPNGETLLGPKSTSASTPSCEAEAACAHIPRAPRTFGENYKMEEFHEKQNKSLKQQKHMDLILKIRDI